MKLSLNNLSDKEMQLYSATISLNGTMEEMEQQLIGNGIFDQYKEVHRQYLELCNETTEFQIKLECIKRLIFLHWYSLSEPNCYTGIQNLDNAIILNSYELLNNFIKHNKLDEELSWMLSYYSTWEWVILPFSENNLTELTKFVKGVDGSILNVPENRLPKGSMDNRGQMGIYYKSRRVEIQ